MKVKEVISKANPNIDMIQETKRDSTNNIVIRGIWESRVNYRVEISSS